MQAHCDEPIVIDLDDPAPRGARLAGVIVAFIIIALLAAPYVMDTRDANADEVPTAHQVQTAPRNEFCQPSLRLPGALAPVSKLAMPSFMWICDWFGTQRAPVTAPINAP